MMGSWLPNPDRKKKQIDWMDSKDLQSLVFCKAFKALLFTLHQKTIVYQITKPAQANKPIEKIFIEVIDQFSSTMVFSNWYLFILFYFLHSDNP